MDSRLRGNDGNMAFGVVSVIPAQAGIHEKQNVTGCFMTAVTIDMQRR